MQEAAEHLCNAAEEEMPCGGTLRNGATLVRLRVSWELSDTKGTLCKDLTSVPGTELGNVRTWYENSIGSEEEDPQANWNESHHAGGIYTQLTGWFLEQP